MSFILYFFICKLIPPTYQLVITSSFGWLTNGIIYRESKNRTPMTFRRKI